jgi:DNA mismatch endonuclease (patch repair protein)
VLPASRQVVLVHGCFWHSHSCRRGEVHVATRAAYWEPKRARVVDRDRQVAALLRSQGWHVCVIWECWTKDTATLTRRLTGVIRRASAVS